MPLGAIIAGVGALAGGIMSGNAAGRAADQSAAAARDAADAQMQMYQQTREDLAPQREAQRYALDALLSMTGLPALSAAKAAPSPALAGPRSRAGFLSQLGGAGVRGLVGRNSQYGGRLSLADIVSGNAMPEAPPPNMLPPVPRQYGGPTVAGQDYLVGEVRPEILDTADGRREVVGLDGPEVITPSAPGYVTPSVQPIGLPGIGSPSAPPVAPAPTPATPPPFVQATGTPIPGSTVTENPGGQPGRYNFMTDPGYGFRFDEGLRAIERSAAARGMGLSGGILKALTRYGQGTGSAEYGNVYNRLSNIAGLGQTGQSLTAQAGMGAAANQGSYLSQIGQANAAGTIGRASSYADTLEQLSRLYGQYGGTGTRTGYSAGGGILTP